MYLTHLQLKIARSNLKLGVRDIGNLIQTSRTTISKLENNIIKLSEMRLAERRNIILCQFFKKEGITFPNKYTVYFSSELSNAQKNISLTHLQIRSARIILKQLQKELSNETKIEVNIINRLEKQQSHNKNAIEILKTHFETKGILFPDPFSIIFKNFS